MPGVFGWDYPPGVTGNEPQITGEWPPCVCGHAEEDHDGEEGPVCTVDGCECQAYEEAFEE